MATKCSTRIFGIFLVLMGMTGNQVSSEGISSDSLADSAGQSRTFLNRYDDFVMEKSQRSHMQIDFSETQYTSEAQTINGRQDYTNLGLDIDLKSNGKEFNAGAHGIYQGLLQSDQEQYYGVPELYIGESKRSSSGVRLTVGRQKRHWSYFDEEFGMGVWQPQLRWDYLDPIQQGMTGIFLDYDVNKNVSATVFTSPVFLPDQGPNFRITDGQFETSNRWFWAPRRTISYGVNPQQNPISYELDRPRFEDIIFQSSLGLNVQYRPVSSRFWWQTSYAYKPMNQLHLEYDCPRCADIVGGVRPVIHPSVLMHRVATMETGLQDGSQRGWLSVTSDTPTSPRSPSNWGHSSDNPVVFAGASYEHAMSIFSRPGWLKLSYLRAFEERNTRAGTVVDERMESSLDRYPYQEIAAVEWSWLMTQRVSSQLTWRTRYTYSIPERGAWISSQVWLQVKRWSWNLGIDILGAEIDPLSSDAGLFSRYRANDRASGGMSYAF